MMGSNRTRLWCFHRLLDGVPSVEAARRSMGQVEAGCVSRQHRAGGDAVWMTGYKRIEGGGFEGVIGWKGMRLLRPWG